jgi:hypothetical protein
MHFFELDPAYAETAQRARANAADDGRSSTIPIDIATFLQIV